MSAALRIKRMFCKQVFTSVSKSEGTFRVFRSAPIWPDTYSVPPSRIPGLNGSASPPCPANSGGATTFFSAKAAGLNIFVLKTATAKTDLENLCMHVLLTGHIDNARAVLDSDLRAEWLRIVLKLLEYPLGVSSRGQFRRALWARALFAIERQRIQPDLL